MNAQLADLLRLLELEPLEVNLFRGESRDIGSAQVFGGQVLGQALTAASATIEGRIVHSLHAYFLRRGDFNAPIVYQVDRSLDGHSFSNRRVVAIQHGEPIFNMAASFQVLEEGFEHQIAMPTVPPPEELPDSSRPPPELLARLPERLRRFLEQPRPFEFRLVQPFDYVAPQGAPPSRQVWFRAVDRLPADERLHRRLLAYLSDYFLLDTATLPHGSVFLRSSIVMASIDHAMWFHRPLRVDDWLLYAVESPSASGARGFARANVYARDAKLVASTAQEGLVRLRRERAT
ncbi:MAG TPA: acyl-CoA thioesterase II [Steroidobacteraceae bacterium]|jgi:acyl-CoA thioesterase-2|nr:acyl-CoA thioesterase II [Steroidobacteraceae bacterium]HTL92169.1 acyl-CoA thioesterase II [Steroidobacteraceae bacterium]